MRFLSIILIVFLAGCGQPSTDGAASTKQSSDASLSFKYQCESGQTIKVSYPTDSTAVVDYDDRRLQMKIAVSGSGARYVGHGLEWWTKGSGEGASGTLFRHLEDGTSGEAVEQCAQVADAA
ncbi:MULTISPECIES: MliC family protein [unclassified Marinobacter]|uniref:MliC family protein n=1 Tax=unclassified Marinobacter TaxID=83889 RepID=UPI0018F124ED|nr:MULTISPECIES: MliC family protein [unclassified Marinobacter]